MFQGQRRVLSKKAEVMDSPDEEGRSAITDWLVLAHLRPSLVLTVAANSMQSLTTGTTLFRCALSILSEIMLATNCSLLREIRSFSIAFGTQDSTSEVS